MPVSRRLLSMASSNKSVQSMHTPHDIMDTNCLETKIYPEIDVKHEDLVAGFSNFKGTPKKFKETLENFHRRIGIKSRYPTVAKVELDLLLLYKEVTSRGGLERVIAKNKWKEVASSLNFKSTHNNLSCLLRQHYSSLLWDFEQVHFWRKKGRIIPPPASKRKRKATDTAVPHAKKAADPAGFQLLQPPTNTGSIENEETVNETETEKTPGKVNDSAAKDMEAEVIQVDDSASEAEEVEAMEKEDLEKVSLNFLGVPLKFEKLATRSSCLTSISG